MLCRLDGQTGRLQGPRCAWARTARRRRRSPRIGRRLFVSPAPRQRRTLRDRPAGPARRCAATRSATPDGAVSPDGRLFALGSTAGAVRLLDLRSGRAQRSAGPSRRPIARMRVHARRGHAGDLGRGRSRDRLGRRGAAGPRAFSGHRGDSTAWRSRRTGGRLYSAGRRARDHVGPRRRPAARPALRRRPAVRHRRGPVPDGSRSARTAARSPSPRPTGASTSSTPERCADAAACGPWTATPPRSTTAPTDGCLAVTGKGGRVTLWNARTLRPAGSLRGLRRRRRRSPSPPTAGCSPPPSWGASCTDEYEGSRVRVWDVQGRALQTRELRRPSPRWRSRRNGGMLAAAARATEPRSATCTPVAASRVCPPTTTRDRSRSRRTASSSPRANSTAASCCGPPAPGTQSGRAVEAHEGRVITLSFSGDGTMLASASEDGTVRLWDVGTQTPIGSPLVVGHGAWVSGALTPGWGAPDRGLRPRARCELEHLAGGMGAARLRRGRTGADESGVARCAAGPALPDHLPRLRFALRAPG